MGPGRGRATPHAAPQLVGRSAEIGSLERALDRLGRREAGCVELVGEPGIGKTRLLGELCARADERGHLVLTGRGAEYERDVPFGLVVDALDDYLGSLDRNRFARLGRDRVRELAAVFPALATLDDTPDSVPQAERYRAHHAVRILLERLAADRPLVLALDDVHWADDAAIELLGHLLRRPPRGSLLLALALRPRQTPLRLAGPLDGAVREGFSERLELGPLAREDADTLLGDGVDRATRAAIYRDSGGNPFYLEQLARAAARTGDGDGHADVAATDGAEPALGVPRPVALAIAQELDEIGMASRRVLDAAAVAGEPFEPDLVAAVAELDEREVLAELDDLLARELVRPTEVPRRFRFRHPIVRRAVYESAGGGWRLGAHGRAAAALEANGAGAAARAHHVERSAHAGDDEAVALLTAAANEVSARAPATAAEWLQAALRLLPTDDAAAGRRLELLVPLATAQGASGRLVDARDTLVELLGLLPGDLGQLRAQVTAFVARIEHPLGRHGEARALLRSAIDELPNALSRERVSLGIELATDRFFTGDWPTMRTEADAALHEARELDDRPLLAWAASTVALADSYLDRAGPALALLDEAGAIVDGLSDGELMVAIDTFWWLGWTEHWLERYTDAARHLERGVAASRAVRQGHMFITILLSLAVTRGWQGRLAIAHELADEALEAALVADNDQLVGWTAMTVCWLHTRAGDGRAALRAADEMQRAVARTADHLFAEMLGLYSGEAYLEGGDPHRALAEFDAAHTLGGVAAQSAGCAWQAAAGRAGVAAGDLEAAERWTALSEASAASWDLAGRRGYAGWARAELTLAQGDATAAARAALTAVEQLERSGDRLAAGRTRLVAGRALAAAGDRAAALTALEAARTQLEACDARRPRDEAARELRGLGRRVARAGARGGGEGVASLSEREREIADLVADGHTNREIAATLFLSEKTIETHLSKVFRKLGVRSRTAVAGIVERERERAGA